MMMYNSSYPTVGLRPTTLCGNTEKVRQPCNLLQQNSNFQTDFSNPITSISPQPVSAKHDNLSPLSGNTEDYTMLNNQQNNNNCLQGDTLEIKINDKTNKLDSFFVKSIRVKLNTNIDNSSEASAFSLIEIIADLDVKSLKCGRMLSIKLIKNKFDICWIISNCNKKNFVFPIEMCIGIDKDNCFYSPEGSYETSRYSGGIVEEATEFHMFNRIADNFKTATEGINLVPVVKANLSNLEEKVNDIAEKAENTLNEVGEATASIKGLLGPMKTVTDACDTILNFIKTNDKAIKMAGIACFFLICYCACEKISKIFNKTRGYRVSSARRIMDVCFLIGATVSSLYVAYDCQISSIIDMVKIHYSTWLERAKKAMSKERAYDMANYRDCDDDPFDNMQPRQYDISDGAVYVRGDDSSSDSDMEDVESTVLCSIPFELQMEAAVMREVLSGIGLLIYNTFTGTNLPLKEFVARYDGILKLAKCVTSVGLFFSTYLPDHILEALTTQGQNLGIMPVDLKPAQREVYVDCSQAIDIWNKQKTPTNAKIWLAAYNKLLNLSISAHRFNAVTKQMILNISRIMKDQFESVKSMKQANQIRPRPIVVNLNGPPGTGKSTFSQYIVKMISGGAGWYDPNRGDFDLGFSDGFNWHIVDDAQPVNAPSRFFNSFLSTISENPHILEGPFEKGIPYTSLLTVYSTNCTLDACLQINKVMSKDAFYRRHTGDHGFVFKVTCLPEYRTEARNPQSVADFNKINALVMRDPDARHTFPWLQFQRYNPLTGVTNRAITAVEAMRHISIAMIKSLRDHIQCLINNDQEGRFVFGGINYATEHAKLLKDIRDYESGEIGVAVFLEEKKAEDEQLNVDGAEVLHMDRKQNGKSFVNVFKSAFNLKSPRSDVTEEKNNTPVVNGNCTPLDENEEVVGPNGRRYRPVHSDLVYNTEKLPDRKTKVQVAEMIRDQKIKDADLKCWKILTLYLGFPKAKRFKSLIKNDIKTNYNIHKSFLSHLNEEERNAILNPLFTQVDKHFMTKKNIEEFLRSAYFDIPVDVAVSNIHYRSIHVTGLKNIDFTSAIDYQHYRHCFETLLTSPKEVKDSVSDEEEIFENGLPEYKFKSNDDIETSSPSCELVSIDEFTPINFGDASIPPACRACNGQGQCESFKNRLINELNSKWPEFGRADTHNDTCTCVICSQSGCFNRARAWSSTVMTFIANEKSKILQGHKDTFIKQTGLADEKSWSNKFEDFLKDVHRDITGLNAYVKAVAGVVTVAGLIYAIKGFFDDEEVDSADEPHSEWNSDISQWTWHQKKSKVKSTKKNAASRKRGGNFFNNSHNNHKVTTLSKGDKHSEKYEINNENLDQDGNLNLDVIIKRNRHKISKINHCMGTLTCNYDLDIDGRSVGHTGRGTIWSSGIKTYYAMEHYFEHVNRGITLELGTQKIPLSISQYDIMSSDHTPEVVLLTISPQNINPSPQPSLDSYAYRSKLPKKPPYCVHMSFEDGKPVMSQAKDVRLANCVGQQVYVYDSSCSPHKRNGKQQSFENGDCGDLLMLVDSVGDLHVLGVHYGKKGNTGYAHLLCPTFQKHFSVTLASHSSIPWAMACQDLKWDDNLYSNHEDEEGTFKALERVPKSFDIGIDKSLGLMGVSDTITTMSIPSKVRHTGMAKGVPYFSLPALSKDSPSCDPEVVNDPRSIEVQLFDKFKGPASFPDGHAVRELFDYAFSTILPIEKKKTVLTVEECLNTQADGYLCSNVNLNTSAGPDWWATLSGDPSKKGLVYFDETTNRWKAQEEYAMAILEEIKIRKSGIVPMIYAAFAKKDEPRALKPGTTFVKNPRAILVFPLMYQIIWRMYFSSWDDAFMRSTNSFRHASGLDYSGADADYLIKDLLAKSDTGFSGDFKSFDSIHPADWSQKFSCRVCDLLYSVDNDMDAYKVRCGLLMNINTMIIAMRANYAYEVTLNGETFKRIKPITVLVSQGYGCASGSRVTSQMGCVCTKVNIGYCFNELVWKPNVDIETDGIVEKIQESYCSMSDALEILVHTWVNGDDNINAIHSDIGKVFNIGTIGQNCLQRGYQITDSLDKDSALQQENSNILSLSFLARTISVDSSLFRGCRFGTYPTRRNPKNQCCDLKANCKPECFRGQIWDKTVGFARFTGKNEDSELIREKFVAYLHMEYGSGRDTYNMARSILNELAANKYILDPPLPIFDSLHSDKYREVKRELFDVDQVTEFHMFALSVTTNKVYGSPGTDVRNDSKNSSNPDTTIGYDNPMSTQDSSGLVFKAFPSMASGDGMMVGEMMGINNSKPPVPSSWAEQNIDSFIRLCDLTYFDKFTFSNISSGLVYTTPICPNASFLDRKVGESFQPNAMNYFSSFFGYWSGDLCYSFDAIIPTVGVCKIGVGVIYDPDNYKLIGYTREQLLSQTYIQWDVSQVNSRLNVRVPWNSESQYKEIARGQRDTKVTSDPQNYRSACTGTLFAVVLNPLRIPNSASMEIEVLVCNGGAKDGRILELRTPFMANRTVLPYIATVEDVIVDPPNEYHSSVEVGSVSFARSTSSYHSLSVGGPSESSTEKRWTNNINSILQLMRRKTMVANSDGAIGDLWTLDPWLALQIGHPDGSSNPMNVIQDNYLARLLAPFALCSGSLNVTVIFGAQFSGNIYIRYQQSSGTASLTDYPEITANSVNNLPMILCRSEIPYVQFQVPFGSRFDAIQLNGPLYPDGQQPKEYSTCGTIIFSSASIGQLLASRPVVYLSVGDDFVLGPLRWIPKVLIQENSKPDYYILGPTKDLEDDVKNFEIVEVPDALHMDVSANVMTKEVSGVHLPAETIVVNEHKAKQSYVNSNDQRNMTFNDFMRATRFKTSFTWDMKDAVGHVVYSVPIPLGLLSQSSDRAVQSFVFVGGLEVDLLFKALGTINHAGRLVAYVMPYVSDLSGLAGATPVNMTVVNHCYIDAMVSGTVLLKVPFQSLKPYLITTRPPLQERTAMLYVSVLSPLTVGEGGETSVEISLFSSFPDAELSVIKPI